MKSVIPAWISSLMQIGRAASNNSVAPAEAMLCHTVLTTGRSTPLDRFHTQNLEAPIEGTGSSNYNAEISSSNYVSIVIMSHIVNKSIMCAISEYTLCQSISLSASALSQK